jgi:DNA-binding MarR family transcriptional regulator
MPETDRIPDALILAAAKRARIHQGRPDEGVALSQIKAHLNLPHNGWTTQQIQPQIDRMEAAGLIVRERRHSRTLWSVTPQGRRRASPFRELPEAPQHLHWREARDLAAEHIDALRGDVQVALDEAGRLIYARSDADSDAWFEMSERLRLAARRVGSATYCLREWVEPDDAKADTDDRLSPDEKRLDRVEQAQRRARRQGRRNTRWSAE